MSEIIPYSDLMTISMRGGGYFISDSSNVLMFFTGFESRDCENMNIFLKIARKYGINFIAYPQYKIDKIEEKDYATSSIKLFFNRFLGTPRPYYLIFFLIYGASFTPEEITDETIYIKNSDIVNTFGFVENVLKKKIQWIYPRNDHIITNAFFNKLNGMLPVAEKKVSSTYLLFGMKGLKNLIDFLIKIAPSVAEAIP